VQPGQDRDGDNDTGPLHRPTEGRIHARYDAARVLDGAMDRSDAPDIATMDLFVVPAIGFDLLHVLVIVRLRHLVWNNVTPNPTAEWIARQSTLPCLTPGDAK
jgi:hypothetical protein